MPRRCNGLNDQASLIYIVLVFVECYLKFDEDGGMLSSEPSEEPRVDRREGGALRVTGSGTSGRMQAIIASEASSSSSISKSNWMRMMPILTLSDS